MEERNCLNSAAADAANAASEINCFKMHFDAGPRLREAARSRGRRGRHAGDDGEEGRVMATLWTRQPRSVGRKTASRRTEGGRPPLKSDEGLARAAKAEEGASASVGGE